MTKSPILRPETTFRLPQRLDSRDVLIEEICFSPRPRQRELSEAAVEEKMRSMAEVGQISPIILRSDGGVYELVAGLHRLEAAKRLGWPKIRADILDCDEGVAWLLEMDDNLAGAKLTVLDLALALHDRKAHYEAENPAARRGGDRKSAQALQGKNQTEIISVWSEDQKYLKNQRDIASFCAAASKQLGWSERHVRNMVKLGGRAREEYKGAQWAEHIRGTSAATHFVELRELFRDDHDDATRFKILQDLRSATPSKSVRAARDKALGIDLRSFEDVIYQALADKFVAATPRARQEFFYLCAKAGFAAEMRAALDKAAAPDSPPPKRLLNPLEQPRLEAAPKLLPSAAKKKG